VLVPGHTAGSAALHFGGLDALFAGDAIATYSVTTGRVGPQLAPFGANFGQAYDSLERLAATGASLVLPGHGEPWTAGAAEAVRIIREAGRPES
jgi:glyoxylase-like metal-dependent hydrolase (beta-lactamase superfamily II)